MKAYRVAGTTDEVTNCELCGRDELKGTVVLEPLDADGNGEGVYCYFGSSCAAKAAGWTQREVTRRVKVAKEEERERERREQEAERAAEREFLANWYMEHYGTPDLIEAAKRAGMSTVRTSDPAIRALRAHQAAQAEAAVKVASASAPAASEAPAVDVVDVTPNCPVQAQPGNYHFEGRCEDCDALYLSKMTANDVEHRYYTGRVSQDQFEAYMHVWATSATRYGTDARLWATVPTDPEVIRIATAIRKHAGVPTLAEPVAVEVPEQHTATPAARVRRR